MVEQDYSYYGDFVGGRPHGNGQEKKKDLDFTGEFGHGKKQNGKLVHSQYVYEGQFKNDLFDGKGKINYPSHSINYQGNFKNGNFHGEGLITFKDKYQYEG